ncbi:hypothetical protein MLD38_024523 [Melastoma candidum]|uniref:Uncharacterized protein n=1 Tax=Melastoma candidum TaxID=119954 RepID=A0ACB9NXM7_9MYRT|nr:hypothetical protein MLD38_024523 [Melastoma candidum]
MGSGVSSGRGQSSLGYLFGSGDTAGAPRVSPKSVEPATSEMPATNVANFATSAAAEGHVPARIQGSQKNNYFRAEGQNCGNFITESC